VSKIRLTPNASGTGTVTLTVPSTSTDRTITLPDTTGTLLDSSGVMVDQWRLTTNMCGPANDVLITNWERVDNASFGYIGTGMTHSSGTFTFPSTGIYKVVAVAGVYGTSADNQVGLGQWFTTDNSTYVGVAYGYTGDNPTSVFSGTAYTSCLYDVTDVSLCKIQFKTYSINSSNNCLQGTTSNNQTTITFERLGDT
jgi:hypothetical protein